MKPLLMLLSLHEQSRSLLETDEAGEAFNDTENKARGSLKWEVWGTGNESLSWVKWEKGEWKEEIREKKWEFGQIPSSLAILYSKKWLEITIHRSSRVQKYN